MSELLLIPGLIAVILVVVALASGLVERSPLSFPIVFLGLGFLLGQQGLGFIEMDAQSPTLVGVATLTLALVLFMDAMNLQLAALGRRWLIPALILGPGTALIIIMGAVPLAMLLGFGWAVAFLGAAILASTDPVILRDLIRERRIPASIRQILRIEAGTNDIIVLPVILILIAVAQSVSRSPIEWTTFMAQLLLIGPVLGFAIGAVGAWVMKWVDARFTIRKEQQALYAIGLLLAAYDAATFASGDGFLAAFAAGLAISLLNARLRESFMGFGDVTSEMAILLTSVLFGAILSTILHTVNLPMAIALAAMIIFVIRPSALALVLARTPMSREAKALISWFGPRGINSLLLALLVVNAGVEGGELLLATIGVVVLASALLHGAGTTPLGSLYKRRAQGRPLTEFKARTADALVSKVDMRVMAITPGELYRLLHGPTPPIVLDVRTQFSYDRGQQRIPGSVWVSPQRLDEWVEAHPGEIGLVVAYATEHDEAVSVHTVSELSTWGITAMALTGGLEAWASRYPVEGLG